LFVSLGNIGGNHVLTLEEACQLVGYLLKGGNLYMEGYATWYYQNNTPLHPFFKYTTQKDHVYMYYSVEGVTGSFTDSMSFNYENSTYYALFTFVPVAPAVGIFTNSDTTQNFLQIAYGGDDYKTIGSVTEYGSLIDGESPSKKILLMRRYLDFFDVATAGPKPLFHCDENSVCRWHNIDFTDDSFDNVISWQWEFPGGTPSTSTARNPSVYYPDAGNYDVKLTVSDGVHSRSIMKEKFINVNVCAGEAELSNKPAMIVFPNPAKSLIRIRFPEPLREGSKLYIFDLMGRKVMERSFNKENIENGISVDVSTLPKGLYIIKLISATINLSTKVVIE
jgi:hypothetical protein